VQVLCLLPFTIDDHLTKAVKPPPGQSGRCFEKSVVSRSNTSAAQFAAGSGSPQKDV
jgi:hypothetical protein